MTDSECQRGGYDKKTERYKVPMWKPPVPPAEDQCPECRSAPGQEHNPDCPEVTSIVLGDLMPDPVNIPLPLQERLLESFLLDEWTVAVAGFMERHKDRIVDLCFARLRDGFKYGSRMYGWSPGQRTEEALEEVADLVNYLSSGEVE